VIPLCQVCQEPVDVGRGYIYHARLGVYVHMDCPMTDVCGEDISTHTVQVFPKAEWGWKHEQGGIWSEG
jgi:hypothetical protein